jgi:hypothetical protein
VNRKAGEKRALESETTVSLSRFDRAQGVTGLPFRLRLLRTVTDAALWVQTIFAITIGALLLASIVTGGLDWEWYVAWVAGGFVSFAALVLMNFEVQRVELFDYVRSEAEPNNLAIELRDAAEYDAQWQAAERLRDRELARDEREILGAHAHVRRFRLRRRRPRRPDRRDD